MSKSFEQIETIKRSIPEAARYEQMAEECVELAQALLKKARKLRGENYTPKTFKEIDESVVEEFSDVILCSLVLDLDADHNVMTDKLSRWAWRNNIGVTGENN